MKSSVIIGGLLAIILIVVAGLYFMRQNALVSEPTVSIEEDEQANVLVAETPALTPQITPSPTTSPATPTQLAAATISMTDTGFLPATITVPVGTTVTFVNNGQGEHWPASAVHPTHQELPGFDALRGLSTGETYSYTFTQKGTWRYHDHLNAQLVGSVIVQ